MLKSATRFTAAAIAVAGLSTAAAAQDKVSIGVPNWPSVNITANVIKVIAEENFGTEVELVPGTNAVVFKAMDRAKGDIDVHPEVWMPNQENLAKEYVQDKKSVVMSDQPYAAVQGICVTKQTSEEHGITKITQLVNPDVSKLFDSNDDGKGELWVGAPGWASTNVEKVRAKSYGYSEVLELTEMDETLAYANLDNAIKAKEPWVGFCYTPHYVFALHELHALEEPPYDASKWTVLQPTDDPAWLEKSSAAVAWDTAYLHLHYAKALESDYPEVATIMANMQLTTEEVSAMTFALVIEKQEPLDYAKSWVKENEDRVLGWMTQ